MEGEIRTSVLDILTLGSLFSKRRCPEQLDMGT